MNPPEQDPDGIGFAVILLLYFIFYSIIFANTDKSPNIECYTRLKTLGACVTFIGILPFFPAFIAGKLKTGTIPYSEYIATFHAVVVFGLSVWFFVENANTLNIKSYMELKNCTQNVTTDQEILHPVNISSASIMIVYIAYLIFDLVERRFKHDRPYHNV